MPEKEELTHQLYLIVERLDNKQQSVFVTAQEGVILARTLLFLIRNTDHTELLDKYATYMWGSKFRDLRPLVAEKLLVLAQMLDEFGYVRIGDKK